MNLSRYSVTGIPSCLRVRNSFFTLINLAGMWWLLKLSVNSCQVIAGEHWRTVAHELPVLVDGRMLLRWWLRLRRGLLTWACPQEYPHRPTHVFPTHFVLTHAHPGRTSRSVTHHSKPSTLNFGVFFVMGFRKRSCNLLV
jgi:hypothetical protein